MYISEKVEIGIKFFSGKHYMFIIEQPYKKLKVASETFFSYFISKENIV